MTDFNKILEQAKFLQEKVKDSQEKIKKIEVEGVSGGNTVKIKLDGDGEIVKIDLSPEIMKEKKEIVEDLIIAAHSDAKRKLKSKTSDELSKITGGVPLPPGFKWPF
jgi:nucleoid-associated protein EbfC